MIRLLTIETTQVIKKEQNYIDDNRNLDAFFYSEKRILA